MRSQSLARSIIEPLETRRLMAWSGYAKLVNQDDAASEFSSITGKGVTVFDPRGEKIEHVAIDEAWTANVCFGGKDRHTLFITASKNFYGRRMRVKGAY